MRSLKSVTLVLAILMIAMVTKATEYLGDITAVQLGMNGVALVAPVTSETIVLDLRTPARPDKGYYNQVTFIANITAGTSTNFRIRCKASQTDAHAGAGWTQRCYGPTAVPGTCELIEDIRDYTLTGDIILKSEWRFNNSFAWCEVSDTSCGNGTVVMTARRGLQ